MLAIRAENIATSYGVQPIPNVGRLSPEYIKKVEAIQLQVAAVEALLVRGFKKNEIARIARVSDGVIGDWLSGKYVATKQHINRLLVVCNNPHAQPPLTKQFGTHSEKAVSSVIGMESVPGLSKEVKAVIRTSHRKIVRAIVRRLHAYGHTHNQIAALAEVSRACLDLWMRGKTTPSAGSLRLLMRNAEINLSTLRIVEIGDEEGEALAAQQDMIDYLLETGYSYCHIAKMALSAMKTVKKWHEGTTKAPATLAAVVRHVRTRDVRAMTSDYTTLSNGRYSEAEGEARAACMTEHDLLAPFKRVARLQRLIATGIQKQDLSAMIGVTRGFLFRALKPAEQMLFPVPVTERFVALEARMLVEDCFPCQTKRVAIT